LSVIEGMIGRIRHVFADDFPHATVKTDLQKVKIIEIKSGKKQVRQTMPPHISNLQSTPISHPFSSAAREH
jgi:hypothetical protein